MKAKELIAILKQAGEDKPVFMSCDTEGNGYATIGPGCVSVDKKMIVIYPYHERLEHDELLNAEKEIRKP